MPANSRWDLIRRLRVNNFPNTVSNVVIIHCIALQESVEKLLLLLLLLLDPSKQ